MQRNIEVNCTWGDGPDVMMTIDDIGFDLTAREALDLSSKLCFAAMNAQELEQSCKDHDDSVKDNLLETIKHMKNGDSLVFDNSDEEFELIKNDKEIKKLLKTSKFKVEFFEDKQQLAMPDSSTVYLVEAVKIKKVKE